MIFKMNIGAYLKSIWGCLVVSLAILGLLNPLAAVALTPDQKKIYDSNIGYFDIEEVIPSGCSGGGNLIGSVNAEKIFNFFAGRGYTPFQAAGIAGNIGYESGFETQRLQGTKPGVQTPAESLSASQLSRPGFGWGLVQFTPPGKFINTVTPTSDANKLEVQLEFVWNQLEGKGPLPEKRAGDQIKTTTTIEQAVLAFQGNRNAGGPYFGYERPADQRGTVAKRTAIANDVFALYGSGSSGGVAPGGGASGGCGGDDAVSVDGCPTAPVTRDQIVDVQGIPVHQCISVELDRILTLAKSQGLNLGGTGWRDPARQIALRQQNCPDPVNSPPGACSPPTAKPGSSNHEKGTAVDFRCGGRSITSRSSACFQFLANNTSLKNLPSEPWHWSNNGK